MFRSSFQSGYLSILYSIGSKPLQLWDVQTKDGSVDSVTDEELESKVLALQGANLSTTFVSCPAGAGKTLSIKLPWLVLLVKNMDQHFSLEVEILDDKKTKRRFRASTFQSSSRVTPNICTMPLKLQPGWNDVRFDLADFCRRAYGTEFVEALRVTVHANCRLRRIYFAEKSPREEELPAEFKLFKVNKGHVEVAAAGVAVAADGKENGGDEAVEEVV